MNNVSKTNLKEKLARLCKESYFSKNPYIEYTNTIGLQGYIYLNHDDKTIYIIFRGTDEMKDWKSSLSFLPTDIGNSISVHRGYQKLISYENVVEKMVDEVDRVYTTFYKYDVYVTGHSLGGGLAQLFAYYLHKNKKIKPKVVIFGSFCIGNLKFQDYLKNNGIYCINYKFASDPVPKLLRHVYFNYYTINVTLPNLEKKLFINTHSIMYYLEILQTISYF